MGQAGAAGLEKGGALVGLRRGRGEGGRLGQLRRRGELGLSAAWASCEVGRREAILGRWERIGQGVLSHEKGKTFSIFCLGKRDECQE
jgi:hypothetical protein